MKLFKRVLQFFFSFSFLYFSRTSYNSQQDVYDGLRAALAEDESVCWTGQENRWKAVEDKLRRRKADGSG